MQKKYVNYLIYGYLILLPEISISPFYSYAQSVISGKPKYCTHSSCLKHWLSVHSNGDIYPCGRYYPEEYRLGNIMHFNDLHDVFETKIYKNIINKSAIRKQKCREQCNVYHLCNGGCLNRSVFIAASGDRKYFLNFLVQLLV